MEKGRNFDPSSNSSTDSSNDEKNEGEEGNLFIRPYSGNAPLIKPGTRFQGRQFSTKGEGRGISGVLCIPKVLSMIKEVQGTYNNNNNKVY